MSKIRLQCQTFSSISIKSQVNISRNGKHCNKPKKETKQIPKKKKEITVTKAYLTKRERGKKKYKEMMKKEKLTNYRVEVQELKYGENTQNS